MRIYHNQLTQTLSQGLATVYLVFGDEPWQKNDALFQIKSAAKQQGFDELIRFSSDDKFAWDELISEYQAMSLFSSRRIIEVELTSNKIGDAANKLLTQLGEQLISDVVLVFHGVKADAATTNKKWFKEFSKAGVYLPIYDLDSKGLSIWLSKRIRHYQLNLGNDGVNLLLTLFEGNVLALEQELQKLAILFGNQNIAFDELSNLVINQTKFNPFALIDALLQGDIKRTVAIIDQLQQEGTAFSKVVWFVHKELKLLREMFQAKQSGQNFNETMKQCKVWDKRKPLYQHVLSNSSSEHVDNAQVRLIDADLISKTTSDFNAYLLLADVCISLYHSNQTTTLSLNYEYQ